MTLAAAGQVCQGFSFAEASGLALDRPVTSCNRPLTAPLPWGRYKRPGQTPSARPTPDRAKVFIVTYERVPG
jgi:hypothetical protein